MITAAGGGAKAAKMKKQSWRSDLDDASTGALDAYLKKVAAVNERVEEPIRGIYINTEQL